MLFEIIEHLAIAQHISIIEDEEGVSYLMRRAVSKINPGALVHTFGNFRELEAFDMTGSSHVVLSDYNFPIDSTGIIAPNARLVFEHVFGKCSAFAITTFSQRLEDSDADLERYRVEKSKFLSLDHASYRRLPKDDGVFSPGKIKPPSNAPINLTVRNPRIVKR
ncbi:MAG: hypothetical protein PHU63_02595 [Candidatus ainarchaeum sp.]|nr:hypothetical protein [Candidatus ainarchaeum sp.]